MRNPAFREPAPGDIRRLLSIQSLWLELRFQGVRVAHGTGFVVNSPSGSPLLFTARHNFTGRHQATDECLHPQAAVPDEVAISHNSHDHYGQWVERVEPLYDPDGSRLWYEHPSYGGIADIAALKLSRLDDEVILYPMSLSEDDEFAVLVGPTDIVSVIGFPFGQGNSGCFGIWATGFVATEPEHDYNGLPAFLIDCRSRPGQSGAPVVAYRTGAIPLGTGPVSFGATAYRLLGLYSGRINEQSDLGMVWKVDLLRQLAQRIPS